MATKYQMWDERLRPQIPENELDNYTKPEIQVMFDKAGGGESTAPGPEELDTESEVNVVDELNKKLSEFETATDIDPGIDQQPKPKSKPRKKSKFSQKTVISGYMMLMIIDLVFPNIVVMLYNKLKGGDLQASDLQLTSEQKEELQPLADEAAKSLSMEINPMYLFLISLGTYYAGNFFALTGNFQLHKR